MWRRLRRWSWRLKKGRSGPERGGGAGGASAHSTISVSSLALKSAAFPSHSSTFLSTLPFAALSPGTCVKHKVVQRNQNFSHLIAIFKTFIVCLTNYATY